MCCSIFFVPSIHQLALQDLVALLFQPEQVLVER